MTARAPGWALFLLVGALGCRDSAGPLADAGTSDAHPKMVVFGVRTNLADNGVLRASLVADSAYVLENASLIDLRGVTVHFLSETGDSLGTLTARRWSHDLRRGQHEARGDVIVTSREGRKLATEVLRLDLRQNEIATDGDFVFTASGRERRGAGFRSDPRLRALASGSEAGEARLSRPQQR